MRSPISIAFCATGRSGLGHLRRIANIAEAIKRTGHASRLTLVTNAETAALSQEESNHFASIEVCERSRMAMAMSALRPDIAVVDTAIIPDIELLPVRLALVLRETVSSKVASFRLPGNRQWDLALIAEPREAWTVKEDDVGASHVANVGWIYRKPTHAAKVLPDANGRRTVLIATGGGGSEETAASFKNEIDPVILDLRNRFADLNILQAVGERTTANALLENIDGVVDVGAWLNQAFTEADVVISTAGYNSVLELALSDVPALLVPIKRTYDDQRARCSVWGSQLGMHHFEGEASRSALWIVRSLESNWRRSPVNVGESGCAEAARKLLELSRPEDVISQSSWFPKKCKSGAPGAQVVQSYSSMLFEKGVKTCVGSATKEQDAVYFPRIDGPTAYEIFAASDANREGMLPSRDALRRVLTPLAALHRLPPQSVVRHRLDVLRKITPRLSNTRLPNSCEISRLVDRIAGEILPLVEDCRQVVHGDFHFRQVLQPNGCDHFVLIDLDDLALGPPAADLGNCIAHIVSSGTEPVDGTIDRAKRWMLELLAAYQDVNGDAIRLADVERFVALALIRRGLKLAETGDPHLKPVALACVEAAAMQCSTWKPAASNSIPSVSAPEGVPL